MKCVTLLLSFLLYSLQSAATVGPIYRSGTVGVCVGDNVHFLDTTIGGIWTSSDTSVAIIDSGTGYLHAVSAGSVTITYATTSGFVTTSLRVGPAVPDITGPSFLCTGWPAEFSTTMPGGGTWTCFCIFFNFSTTTPNSVTVLPHSPGTDRLYFADTFGCSISREIDVVSSPPPITGDMNVYVGATTILHELSSGSWVSKNTAIATVDASGTVTGISPGFDTVVFFSYCPRATVVTVMPVTGIEELSGGVSDVTLSPNPAVTSVTIAAASPINSVSICNVMGQEIFNKGFNDCKINLDISDFPSGIYLIHINGAIIKKLVKQ